MSERCLAASKPASVVTTTGMPARANSSVAPAVTAFTKSDEVCQSSAALWPLSFSPARSASERVISDEGVALSPPGPTVCVQAGPASASAASAHPMRFRRMVLLPVVMAVRLTPQ